MCIIRIVEAEGTEFLELKILRRSHPQCSDSWDGNWLDCSVEVASGAFRGRMARSLRTDELARFEEQLTVLYERLTGEAVFATMERWLSLRITGDCRGHMQVRGQLCDDLAFGNNLDFRLAFDQTFLPRLLHQLAETLEAYPTIGR